MIGETFPQVENRPFKDKTSLLKLSPGRFNLQKSRFGAGAKRARAAEAQRPEKDRDCAADSRAPQSPTSVERPLVDRARGCLSPHLERRNQEANRPTAGFVSQSGNGKLVTFSLGGARREMRLFCGASLL